MPTSEDKLKFFAKYIESKIGIIYLESNYFQLEHRLNDIVTLLGFKDIEELWISAQRGIDGQLKDLLLDLATNNETSFFRDPAIFQALAKNIIPDLKNTIPHRSVFRIWSAAASTGQEAYSIAMTLEQERLKNPNYPDFNIFVSDVSDRVLNKGKSGVYSQLEVQRGMPAKLLIEYFEKLEDNSWKIRSALTDKLQFRRMNLLEPFPPGIGYFDIIFCRNVLIYQGIENKIAIVQKLLDTLVSGGYLILGAAESMLGISNTLKQLQFGTAVVYQKP